MKAIIVLSIAFASSAAVADPFRNLDFEQAITNNIQPDSLEPQQGIGPVSELLPGWQLFFGDAQQLTVGYNFSGLVFPLATLVSRDQQERLGLAPDGQFALGFSTGGFEQFSLVQRGDVSPDAQFLRFNTFGTRIDVSINGSLLTPFGSSGEVNISPFAGQNIELKFTTHGIGGGLRGTRGLDSIAFVVPEPSPVALFGVGAVGLIAWRRWRCRQAVATRQALTRSTGFRIKSHGGFQIGSVTPPPFDESR